MTNSLDYAEDGKGNQLYGTNASGDEVYRFTGDPKLIFAKRDGLPYYAKNRHGKERYPTLDRADYPIPIQDLYYAKDEHGNQYYPQNKHGDERAFVRKNGKKTAIYARTRDGKIFYPKNKLGHEQPFQYDYIFQDDGTATYPLNKDGLPLLPQNSLIGEAYLQNRDGSYQIPTTRNGTAIYAKKRLTNHGALQEYYPADGSAVYEPDGCPLYAKTVDGRIQFPVNEKTKDEYYLKHKKTQSDHVLDRFHNIIPRYARDHEMNEIYPKVVIGPNKEKEFLFPGKYARSADGQPMYPLDEFGNEYTMMDEKLGLNRDDAAKLNETFPLGYPITHDNWVIVPKVDDKPFLTDGLLPPVKESNLVGMLYRDRKIPPIKETTVMRDFYRDGTGYDDYITNVRATRISRSKIHPDSDVLPLMPPPSSQPPSPPTSQPVIPQLVLPNHTLSISIIVMAVILLVAGIMIR